MNSKQRRNPSSHIANAQYDIGANFIRCHQDEFLRVTLQFYNQRQTAYDVSISSGQLIWYKNIGIPEMYNIPDGTYTREQLRSLLDGLDHEWSVSVDAATNRFKFTFTQPSSLKFPDNLYKVLGFDTVGPHVTQLDGFDTHVLWSGPFTTRVLNEVVVHLTNVTQTKASTMANFGGEVRKANILASIPISEDVIPWAYLSNTDSHYRDPGLMIADKHLTHINILLTDREGKELSYVKNMSDYFLALKIETLTIEDPSIKSLGHQLSDKLGKLSDLKPVTAINPGTL